MDKERMEKIKAELLAKKQYEKEHWMDMWNNMKPFNGIDDIPDIPKVKNPEDYENIIVKNLIRCGAIPKDKLEIGAEYEGTCRNASHATWNGKTFDYKRYKWGMWQDDDINHFQDDDGYDLFVPIKKIEKKNGK